MTDRADEIARLRYVLKVLIGWLVPNTLNQNDVDRLWAWLDGKEPIDD